MRSPKYAFHDPAFIAGKIHGVRLWKILWCEGSARLGGHGETAWEVGGVETRARCRPIYGRRANCKRAPTLNCGCGLYALHPSSHHSGLSPAFETTSSALGIAGVVEAWGRVQVHESGFRAQYARPVALAVPVQQGGSDFLRLVENLAAAYRVEILVAGGSDQLAEICTARGWGLDPPVIRELIAPVREKGD